MEQQEKQYLQNFELKLTGNLMAIARDMRFGGGQLYQSDDLEQVWDTMAPYYMADAVPNIPQYPAVAIAWAGYIGMAMARLWDKDWAAVADAPNPYALLAEPRGFDEMDEYIVEQILGYRLESDTAGSIENLMRSLAQSALDAIRHEQIEPQSQMAFHVYARAVRAVYRVGASCQLYRLGYKWTKVGNDENNA